MTYNAPQTYQIFDIDATRRSPSNSIKLDLAIRVWWHLISCNYYPKTTLVFNQQVERKPPFSCHQGHMTYIIDNADEMGSAQQTHHNDSNQRTSSSSASDKSAVINKHRHPEKGAREVQKAASKKTSREVRKAVFKKPIDTEPNQALQEFRRKWHAVSKKKPDQMKLEQFWPVVIEDIFNSPLVQSIRSTHANLEKISNSVWEDIETASSVEDQAG